MAAADRMVGTNTLIEFLPTGGSYGADEKSLDADYTNFDMSRAIDTVDVTAGSETNRYVKGTIKSLDFTVTVFYSDQEWMDDVQEGDEGTLYVYANGNTSGEPRLVFPCIITGVSHSIPFDGAQEIEITGSRQGAMTDDYGTTVA